MKSVLKTTGLWSVFRFVTGCIIAVLLIAACDGAGQELLVLPPSILPKDYKAELADAIDLAGRQYDGYYVSSNGFDVPRDSFYLSQNDKDVLKDAIDTAIAVYEDDSATPKDRRQAIEDLETALDVAYNKSQRGKSEINLGQLRSKVMEAKTAMTGVVTSSAAGVDVLQNEKWVTPEAYAALKTALETAENMLNGPIPGTQAEIDAVLTLLITALEGFNPQLGTSAVNKTLLNQKIHEAQAAMIGVQPSDNGSDVLTTKKWVTPAVYTALQTALNNAIAVAENQNAVQSDVNTALAAITGALNAFIPQPGSLVPGPDFASAKTVNGSADKVALQVELTFDMAASTPGGTDPKTGFTIKKGNGTEYLIDSAALSANGFTLTFMLAEESPIMRNDVVTINYDAAAGSLVSRGNPAAAAVSFSNKPVSNMIVAGSGSPWITRAEVVTGSTNTVRITFNEPVHIANGSVFTVKVNDRPAVRMGDFTAATNPGNIPMLDMTSAIRTVSSAAPATSGKKYDTVWNLTVSASAKHGEVLRLSTNSRSAYVDREGTGLPVPAADPASQQVMSQFIVKNLTPRTEASPTTAGFYQNGVLVGGFTSGDTSNDLYKRAIAWLANHANRTDGAAYTIVLGANQDYTGAATFKYDQFDDSYSMSPGAGVITYPAKTFTIVLASSGGEKIITVKGTGANPPDTNTSNTTSADNEDYSVLVLRNGVTLIIETGVVIQHENQGLSGGVVSKNPLIRLSDGGKLILDGGTLRGNYVDNGTPVSSGNGGNLSNAGAVLLAATDVGANENARSGESYFIMNSGKITGNTLVQHERGAAAGGIVLARKGIFVMHGGEISGNKLIYKSLAAAGGIGHLQAGGIAGFSSGAGTGSVHNVVNQQGVYMTGGAITGNDIASGTGYKNIYASAGGVILRGTLQKTGGTISGNTNNMNSASSSIGRYTQAAVQHTKGETTAPISADCVFYRNSDADENVPLFVEGIRVGSPSSQTDVSAGKIFKPPFVPDPSNGWEN